MLSWDLCTCHYSWIPVSAHPEGLQGQAAAPDAVALAEDHEVGGHEDAGVGRGDAVGPGHRLEAPTKDGDKRVVDREVEQHHDRRHAGLRLCDLLGHQDAVHWPARGLGFRVPEENNLSLF